MHSCKCHMSAPGLYLKMFGGPLVMSNVSLIGNILSVMGITWPLIGKALFSALAEPIKWCGRCHFVIVGAAFNSGCARRSLRSRDSVTIRTPPAENDSVRRSTRQKRLVYDTLNQHLIDRKMILTANDIDHFEEASHSAGQVKRRRKPEIEPLPEEEVCYWSFLETDKKS